MDKAIRILLIEDNPGDARLLEEMLKEADVRFELECINRLSSGIERIKAAGFEIILLDLGLPDSRGLAALTKLNEIGPEAPIVVLTGLTDEAVGIQAVQEGAQDFLVKGQVDKNLLVRSINYAIERKKILGELLKKDEDLKEAQRVGHIGNWDWNAVTDTVAWSEEYCRVFSHDPKAPAPNYLEHLKIYTAESAERLDAAVKKALQTGQPYELDLEIAKPTGPARWICARGEVKRDADGRTVGLRGTAQDITERKKSEELIKNILEHVDEGFIIIDRDFRILSANMAYSKLVEMPLDGIIGKHCYEVAHRLAAPCIGTGNECSIRKVFETRKSCSSIHRHEDSKGRSIHIEIKAYPFSKDPSGEVITAIETLVDITEKQKLEDQLRQSLKMEAIGQLAGGVAHDFNNILTAIIGYGSFALMNMAKDDPQRINIEHMLEGAEKAAHLTKDLLLFSRKQLSERKYVDLNDIIKKMKKFLTRIIGEDISCKTILHAGAIPVLADAHQLEQVMMNLATNARDAMPKGGVFSVTTEQIRLDKEFLTTHGYGQQGMYALITVSDTGKGMDEATRKRIFEPFFTTKEMGRGTGLGLAVVYGIVKGHDGYINVYSEPELGTTFKIYLPLTSVEAEATPESIQPLALGKGETILIAEDEPAVRKVLRLSLEQYGYRVIEAENGEDAVKQYKDNMEEVSLVLLDVIMPIKNGREAFNEIKSLKSDTKVIFMSGYTSDIITEKGMLETDAELILKPIAPDSLIRKIREVLDR